MAELRRLPDVAMAAVRRRDGAGLPVIGKSIVRDGDRVVAIGPDEWLVVGRDGDARALLDRLAHLDAALVDVSGNRVVYRIERGDALHLLASGCALDLETLAPGDAVSTLLARAQVVIVVEEDGGMLVLPRRSFGPYLEDWARSASH